MLKGLAEGVVYPCTHQIWSKWAPPLERSRMVSIPYAGNMLGSVIAVSTCGILAQNYGWESVVIFSKAFIFNLLIFIIAILCSSMCTE